ncbi:MAG: phosphotransferase [Anaerolineaceae bacterium]|nr:phosphotransferase [Anaerolineaceae bacterium]
MSPKQQSILLRDILIRARQESLQAHHYYLGVEHLFIALLHIEGGLTQTVLQAQQIPHREVLKTIYRKIGRGSGPASWPGVRYTPRTEAILDMANDLMLSSGRTDITERDLFSVIVTEKESLPMRLLKIMGADLSKMEQAAYTQSLTLEPHLPDVIIEFGPDDDRSEIPELQLVVLRRMFSKYAKIRIERRLTGFRNALILVATPIHANNQENMPVVVKIDQRDAITEEAQHYAEHIKDAATLYTARLEEEPTYLENAPLGGLKYTLVANNGIIPMDLRNRIQQYGVERLPELFNEMLYNRFKKYWWGQARPYRFLVWQEYDWVLPSILTLDLKTDDTPATTHLLRIPFRRAHLRNTLKKLNPGDAVTLENFTVQKFDYRNKVLKLALKYGAEAENRAFRIDVRLPNIERTYYRGEIVDQLVGTVWKTRDAMLLDAVRALDPIFNPTSGRISVGPYEMDNPLHYYDQLLDYPIHGSASRIHGDLNLSNILVGPENGLWLIDFGHTREGHTLFDWAALEVSLLGDAVMSQAGDSWEAAVKALRAVIAINNFKLPPRSTNPNINQAFDSVIQIRRIAALCMAAPKHWEEYFVALALCSLRALSWDTMPLGGRRLMFLLAGIIIQDLTSKATLAVGDTPSPDMTENLAVVQITSITQDSIENELPQQQTESRTPFSSSSLNTKQLDDSDPRVKAVLDRISDSEEAIPEETQATSSVDDTLDHPD